jgi:hypothetical protein
VRAKQIFEILTTARNSLVKIIAIREFGQPISFVVMVAVQHDLKATVGDSVAEILYKRPIFVQRMDGPAHPEALGYVTTRAGAVKRHHRQRDRTVETDLSIHRFQFVWRCEVTRIVVSNAEFHSRPLFIDHLRISFISARRA